MDRDFIESLVHRRAPLLARARGYSAHVVLGRRLRPFSYWHLELLEGNQNLFLQTWQTRPSSVAIFKQLYLATEICRLRPLKVLRPSWRMALRRKLTVFRWYFWPRVSHRNRVPPLLSLLQEAGKFRAYMADYASRPIPFPMKHSKRIQSPVNIFELELFRRFHPRDRRELWSLSPGEVGWANIAAQEASGAEISIMTEARREARAEAIKQGALRSKRKKNAGGNGNGESNARR